MSTLNPVVAIPPDFSKDQDLSITSTIDYLEYLHHDHHITPMTTAGTSLFSILSNEEIIKFNVAVAENSSESIIGIPKLSLRNLNEFVSRVRSQTSGSLKFLIQYPDRFYDNETLIRYFLECKNCVSDSFYIHVDKIRSATGGFYEYSDEVLNTLSEHGALFGLKEEYGSLDHAFTVLKNLNAKLDIIVAGGSMRRFAFLHQAGANRFLSGIGNIKPEFEAKYLSKFPDSSKEYLHIENKLFTVFFKYGWHRSLRQSLKVIGQTCLHNRMPWPIVNKTFEEDIHKAVTTLLEDIKRL